MLFLKIIVNNVFYCYTVNLSRHNYSLRIKIYYFIDVFYLYNKKNNTRRLEDMANTIFYSLAALVSKILFCHSKLKFICSRHRVISSLYTLQTGARLQNIKRFAIYCHVEHLVHFVLRYFSLHKEPPNCPFLYALERCPSYGKYSYSNMTDKQRGLKPGVRLTEVSVL